MAQRLRIYQDNPQKRVIKIAADILKNGGIIIYPTDTTYGLGADIHNKKAIERILQIKHESKFKALTFICDDFGVLHNYVKISNFAFKIMKRCLPGPYTFVLEATKLVPKLMLHRRKTAGIRVPKDEFCTELIKELGNPIVSTSLPEPDGYILNNPDEIETMFSKRVDLFIEAGRIESLPSSVIDLQGDQIEIIRDGCGDLSKVY